MLGFSQYNLELREPDSDDIEDHPEEHIVDLINFRKQVGCYGDTRFLHEATENVLEILTVDMERFPDDPKPRQALLDMMTRISGDGEMLRGVAVERIIELTLESGDMALYNKTLAVTSFATNFDSMQVAKLLEPHLVKGYLDKGNTVNWNYWLGPLTERSFQDFRQSCILNKFLPNIAAHAGRPFLFNLLRSLWLQSNDPGFLNAPAMCRTIIQHGFEKLIIRIKDFGYNGGTPEPVLLPFVGCIRDCHIGGLSQEASSLVAATSAGLAKSRHSWPRNIGRSRAIMEGLVKHLAGLFERGEAVPVPEFGELVELLIRNFIHTTVPPFPAEPNGWTYDARGYMGVSCPQKRGKHIEEMLLGDTYSFRIETTQTRSPYTLVVTKTGGEHQLKVKKWQDAYQQLNSLVAPFRNEAMRGCLGDEKYRELILLEGYVQYAASVGVAGARRRAPSTWDEPEPQRRRVM
ncbi:hypothetical protein NCS52_00243900 [Fusarium sp. LHS14.1]|nr:hypothetical protein NCS52_00243900 [Fusarium sp. LHS14.1]